jgi:HEAT repeat protein
LPLVPAAPSASAASAWIAAAAAMREGDFDAAERAFDALCRSSDLRTREDARLARAQIWLARHEEARARPELEDLASSGSTPVVRRRAADALRSLESSSKSP